MCDLEYEIKDNTHAEEIINDRGHDSIYLNL